jgi:DNA invertase Pin-like site-specific DNA recombinase
MAKVGYIYKYNGYEGIEADEAWMHEIGCVNIVFENEADEKLRPQLKVLLTSLKGGDAIVVARLSNIVRSVRDLGMLLEFCRVKALRLISRHDRIDSGDIMFTETRTSDILNSIAMLPSQIESMRSAQDHSKKLKIRRTIKPSKSAVKLDRNKLIIDLYKKGVPVDEIWARSGFRSRSSVFRIIRAYGIEQRKPRKAESL